MNIDTSTYDKTRHGPPDGQHGYGPVVAGGPARRAPGEIRAIVIHTTGNKRSTTLADEAKFLYDSDQVSAHFLVGRAGEVIQLLAPEWIAWHAGPVNDPDCGNTHAIGIESHVSQGQQWTPDERAALTELVRTLLLSYPSIQKIVTHRGVAVPPGRKSDPLAWDDGSFKAWAAALLARPVPRPVPYVASAALLATPPSADVPRIVTMLAKLPGQTYTAFDIASIVDSYRRHGAAAGVDWVLALAQCLHETDRLRSWWAQRPRRNPAGLGVTGAKQPAAPPNPDAWVQDGPVWREGLSFSSWDEGVQAHIGHLLCYALRDDEMTPAQLALSDRSPRKGLLPASYRGAARQLVGLNGRWAVPGDGYAEAIVAIANLLVGARYAAGASDDPAELDALAELAATTQVD